MSWHKRSFSKICAIALPCCPSPLLSEKRIKILKHFLLGTPKTFFPLHGDGNYVRCHGQFFIEKLVSVNCIEKTKIKKTKGREWAIFKKLCILVLGQMIVFEKCFRIDQSLSMILFRSLFVPKSHLLDIKMIWCPLQIKFRLLKMFSRHFRRLVYASVFQWLRKIGA